MPIIPTKHKISVGKTKKYLFAIFYQLQVGSTCGRLTSASSYVPHSHLLTPLSQMGEEEQKKQESL